MSRFDHNTASAFGDSREFFGASIASISAGAKARPTVAANLKVSGKAAVAPAPKPAAKPGDARAQYAVKAAAAAPKQPNLLVGTKPAPAAASVNSIANALAGGIKKAVVTATSTKLDAKSSLAGKVTVTAPKVKAAAVAPAVKVTAAPAVKAPAVKAPAVKAAPKPVQAPKPLSAAELAQADADFAANVGKQSTQRPSDAALAKAKQDKGAIQAEISRKGAETAVRNAQYFEDNAQRQKEDLERGRRLAAGPAGQAGVDWGLIPMGVKVLATGAAVIASGGVVAGGIGLTAGGGAIAAAGAADQLIAAVERGGAIAKDAKAAIDTVKDAAKKGDAAAKAAVKVINEVADERKLKGVAAGAVQGLTAEAGKVVGSVKAAVSGGLDTNALLKAATAAAAAGAKPDPKTTLAVSSTFSKAMKDGKVTVTKPTVTLLESIAPATKLWLVTDGGKVINLEAQPSSASSRGWAVYSNGKVVHQ